MGEKLDWQKLREEGFGKEPKCLATSGEEQAYNPAADEGISDFL